MAKDKNKQKPNSNYTAKDIYVLEGLEPVRKRPGMYIGSTGVDGLHHLIWEVVDNSIDEAMSGYANKVEITLLPHDRVRVTDNGRGIPVEKHTQTKKSALETVMCTLHAGGKFGGESYKVAGGLHGVGVSVVNALSIYLRVDVCRDGSLWTQEYSRGKPKYAVKKTGKCGASGTSVTFEPDPEIFKEIKFDLKRILDHLRQQAYLTKGVEIAVRDERTENVLDHSYYSFYFDSGIISYIKFLNHHDKPKHQNIFYTSKESGNILVEIALQYTEDIQCSEVGFANNIHTPEGGMHVTGFRTALTRAINDYAKENDYFKKEGENLTGDDVREGLTAIISVKLKEPQFEGQTKAKLGNPEARTAVEAVMFESFKEFLVRYSNDAKAILEKAILTQKARLAAKAAKETVIRKGVLEGMSLPGKLADCTSREAEESELFIVEGDSAGGSAKQGRNRYFQAILPLRGKILNIEKANLDKALASKEIKSLIIALGTAIADQFDISKLRYHRIMLMADADSDGNHIKTLLLTLFYRYFKPIIEQGYLYVALPPLYRIQKGKDVQYAYSDGEKEKILSKIKSEKEGNITIQRYKGLGEMNPDQLWETTMNPQNRVVKQVAIEDAEEADKVFDVLMGSEVLPRKNFIQAYAKEAKNLDI